MAQYTLTYSTGVQGWPSFYSFIPEWIQGSNNYLYTFNKGDLWRHNVNDNRSNFYGEQYASSVKTCLNESSLETKLFKSINLVGTPGAGWGTTIVSNLQVTGHTTNFGNDPLNDAYTAKEGHMFSYIINPEVSQADITKQPLTVLTGPTVHEQRSVIGVGQFDSAEVEAVGGTVYRINFPLGFKIPPMLAVGDFMIDSFLTAGGGVGLSWWIGSCTAIGINTDTVTPSLYVGRPMVEVDIGIGVFPPGDGGGNQLLTLVKRQQAENYGLLGDYADITLSVVSASAIELFSVGSEVMKSNP